MKGLAHPGGFLNGCGGPLNAVTMKNKGSLVRGTPLICLRQVRYNDGRKEVAYIDESSQHYFKRKLAYWRKESDYRGQCTHSDQLLARRPSGDL